MLPDRFLVIENSTKSQNPIFPGVEVKKEVNNQYNSSTRVRTYSRVRRKYWVALIKPKKTINFGLVR